MFELEFEFELYFELKKNNSSSSGEERCVTSLKTEDESIHFFLFLNSCLLVISWELTRVLEN